MVICHIDTILKHLKGINKYIKNFPWYVFGSITQTALVISRLLQLLCMYVSLLQSKCPVYALLYFMALIGYGVSNVYTVETRWVVCLNKRQDLEYSHHVNHMLPELLFKQLLFSTHIILVMVILCAKSQKIWGRCSQCVGYIVIKDFDGVTFGKTPIMRFALKRQSWLKEYASERKHFWLLDLLDLLTAFDQVENL